MSKLNNLAAIFKHFAEHECKGSSALYYDLSNRIAEDPCLLEIAAQTRVGQPVPNLFLAAVKYCLQDAAPNELQPYYDGDLIEDESNCYQAFKDFIQEHTDQIVSLLRVRRVQTNEVNRSVYLYPVLSQLAHSRPDHPMHLIELGAAAGLNLCCDKYAYEVGSLKFGDRSSSLKLTSDFRNDYPYGQIGGNLPISKRVAIDLNILDLETQQDRRWMRALIWPEHRARADRFDRALEITRACDIDYLEGNAVALLRDCIERVDKDASLCVFHTHMANQMHHAEREALVALIDGVGRDRDICHLFNNIDAADLQLVTFRDKTRRHVVVAQTEGHGRWVKWSGKPLT